MLIELLVTIAINRAHTGTRVSINRSALIEPEVVCPSVRLVRSLRRGITRAMAAGAVRRTTKTLTGEATKMSEK